jgi:hypothetical protein
MMFRRVTMLMMSMSWSGHWVKVLVALVSAIRFFDNHLQSIIVLMTDIFSFFVQNSSAVLVREGRKNRCLKKFDLSFNLRWMDTM